ncbi:peptide chain release factor N(5)-glutamine methyltransferase [Pigmentibacter sp. JX0631]|uniref:peptide chain release factor N(5)-glutamine methyltransferase n=1 Tax=Pigmentibacter sp. JX0631 TaxID=2976982 RepID=UPI0024689786|nr:peptide chain release factor N(5)-glutamine methyltransferase [Pigmentibacter sp. JX0631]WGL61114.1 peptide chain release factor N(5)-glutamine methyltransferase [Pigmentibacter sp. JX0631]
MKQNVEQNKKETVWTIREILNWTTKRFANSGIETPLLDAQLLLSHVLNLPKVQLYIQIDKPLNEVERKNYRDLVTKRLQGEPVAYLLQKKYWHELELFVDERVLIPRPETETLLDIVLQYLKLKNISPTVIFDFCTGSGCLAIALAKKYPNAKVIGVDISADALNVAKINAEKNNVQNTIFLQLDLNLEESFIKLKNEYGAAEVIVSNPPYVTFDEWENLDISVKNYEPKLALVSEDMGLKIGKNITNYTGKYNLLYSAEYIFAMELAHGQPEKVFEQKIQIYPNNHSIWNLPKEQYFSLGDLEDKNRFLVSLNYN